MPSLRAAGAFLQLLIIILFAVRPATLVAQSATLHIVLEDSSGLKPAFLQQIAKRAGAILTRTEIAATVDVCGSEDIARCKEHDPLSRQILVQLIQAPRRYPPRSPFRCLGVSVIDGTGGTQATVFVRAVKDEAAESNMPWMVILAYVAVHEVGHVLLGDKAHTATGLMKPHFDARDYLAMTRDRLSFSSQQIAMLRSRMRGRDAGTDGVSAESQPF